MISVDDVINIHPCSKYTRDYVEELFANREYLSLEDVLNLPIENYDILFLILKTSLVTNEIKDSFVQKLLSENSVDDWESKDAADIAHTIQMRAISSAKGKARRDLLKVECAKQLQFLEEILWPTQD